MTAVTPVEVADRYAGLTRVERFNVKVIEAWHRVRVLSRLSSFLGHHVSRNLIKAVLGNIVRPHHFQRLLEAPVERGVLLCGNHRSYLDNFAICAHAWDYLPADCRFLIPSRTEGLFDRWWSLAANFVLTFFNIYPPIVRGARGGPWGKQVIEILTTALNSGPMVVPIHPEGGRNKGDDQYKLLRGRPGLGKIIHQTRAAVFPVFLIGFPSGPRAVLAANFRRGARQDPLVHMVMGPAVDFSAERQQAGSPALYHEMSQKLIAAIAELIPEDRTLRGLPPLPPGSSALGTESYAASRGSAPRDNPIRDPDGPE